MRLLVTGGRSFKNRKLMRNAFVSFLSTIRVDEELIICHGGARGADTIFGQIATSMGFEVIPYPVKTEIDGPWPAAGVNRNQRMLDDFKPHYALAFPAVDSSGTYDMITRLKRAKIPFMVTEEA